MKTVKIEHTGLVAEIKALGAELVSLRRDGVEYLWQGNPEFWNGQSPLLFPNTGRYWDNRFFLNGKRFEQMTHGFARNMEFDIVTQTTDKVVFALHSSDDTLAVYPFPFFLFVTYQIDADGLKVEWMVRNEGDAVMHFQIGAHPAFNLPDYNPQEQIHGFFAFSPNVPLEYFIPEQKGCIDPSKPLPMKLDAQNMLPITSKTFDIDTYVIESSRLRCCTLLTADRRPWLSVEFQMPVLALWAPTLKRPDCPFVCIEPWCGSCDVIGWSDDLSMRRHEQHLDPGAHFINTYRIRLH